MFDYDIGNYWLKFKVPLYEPPKLTPPVQKEGEIGGVEWLTAVEHVWKDKDIEVDVLAQTVMLPKGTFTLESFLAAARHIAQRFDEVQARRGRKP